MELCGFIEGVGLSYEECMKSGSTEKGLKTIEEDPVCPKCGSYRYPQDGFDANCFIRKLAGEKVMCDWQISMLQCASCGANLNDPARGEEIFSVTPRMIEKLRGI